MHQTTRSGIGLIAAEPHGSTAGATKGGTAGGVFRRAPLASSQLSLHCANLCSALASSCQLVRDSSVSCSLAFSCLHFPLHFFSWSALVYGLTLLSRCVFFTGCDSLSCVLGIFGSTAPGWPGLKNSAVSRTIASCRRSGGCPKPAGSVTRCSNVCCAATGSFSLCWMVAKVLWRCVWYWGESSEDWPGRQPGFPVALHLRGILLGSAIAGPIVLLVCSHSGLE